MFCDASNLGSPSITRCSQVTWLRSSLLQTQQIQVGLGPVAPVFGDRDQLGHVVHLHGAVADQRDHRAVGIGELGGDGVGHRRAHRGEPAGQRAFMPRRIFRSRAYQLAQEPESLVMIAWSGSRGDSSQATRCGLIGLASAMARSSSVSHHVLVTACDLSRQARSDFCCSIGSSARERLRGCRRPG